MSMTTGLVAKIVSYYYTRRRGGGGEVLGLIFGRYVLLGSHSPYPIIVYSVANY